MRSLFLKVFLWFWLVQVLIGAALFLVLALRNPDNPRWRGFVSDSLAWRAEGSAAIYATEGRPGLQRMLRQRRGRRNFPLTAYDGHGTLLAGRPSLEARALALQAADKDETQWNLGGAENLAARRVRSADGNILVLVAQMRPAPPGGGPLLDAIRPLRESPLPLLVLLGISGLVCYGLAAYLAAPAVKLRAATRRLASGDLTSRVGDQMGRRRDELADMGHDFDAMAERMEVLMLAERRLLGDISHELRSPLARLTVALDLAGENHDERTNSYLARIRRESERLNDMIGQLLALTRLESGATQARRAPLDLAKLVAEVAADADFEAKSRARRVEAHTSPCTLNGHNGLLRSAVENVVRNAVRYTAEGSAVEISQCCDESPQGTPAAVIRVRDHGPGVPDEALEKIFNPFYRVADARDRQSGGTGLGLAIAKRAVRYHAGTISAKNAVGGGLEVEIVLPLNAAADDT